MVRHRMAVQIVDIPAGRAIVFHPADHRYQFCIREMVTEQRRKDDVRLPALEQHLPVVGGYPLCLSVLPFFAGFLDAWRVYIPSYDFCVDPMAPAIAAQYPEVVSASAADLAYPDAVSS